jgi:hypothetical protein
MSENTPITRIVEEIPKTAKRLWKFVLNPSIPSGPIMSTSLNRAHIDLFATAFAMSTVISVGSDLMPGLFNISPGEMINWSLFAVLLMVYAVLFSVILYLLLWFPLWLKAKEWHSSLIYHAWRFFAVQNILLSVLFVSSLNRLIMKGSFVKPTGSFDYIFTPAVSIVFLIFTIWLLAWPVSMYIKQYYRSAGAYALGFGAVILTSIINPVVASEYFSNVINYEQFCSEFVSVHFKNQIESGQLSKDCVIGECLSAKGKRTVLP